MLLDSFTILFASSVSNGLTESQALQELRKESLVFTFSRACGNGAKKKSYHAEMMALRSLRQRFPERFRASGDGLCLVIVSLPGGGGSAKPCAECLRVLHKVLPKVKVQSFRHFHMEMPVTQVTSITPTKSTWGTKCQ